MSSPPPPYSSRPNSSYNNNNDLHIKTRNSNTGILPGSLPGAIDTPPIISIQNPGYYSNRPQHPFPGLREGPDGVTTPDGGRYVVSRGGTVEYLTKDQYEDRQQWQCIGVILGIIIMLILGGIALSKKVNK